MYFDLMQSVSFVLGIRAILQLVVMRGLMATNPGLQTG